MKWLRFSLASVMVLIVYVAVGFAAFANVDDPWYGRVFDDAYYMISVFILAIATILSVLRRGRSRAIWLGFAVFGWVHLLFGWPDSGGSARRAHVDGLYRPRFPHTTLLQWAIQDTIFSGGAHPLKGDFTWHVLQTTIMMGTALVGALVGNLLWDRNEPQEGRSGRPRREGENQDRASGSDESS
jgi:hypothetical protein